MMKWMVRAGVVAILLLAALPVFGERKAAGIDFRSAEFSYDTSPNAVIVSFREVLAELSEQDPVPLIRVFGDRRVAVHYPDYSRFAGDYEAWLRPTEFEELLQSLVEKGIATLDSEAVRAEKRTVMLRRRTEALAGGETPPLVLVADASISVLEFNLESYRPPGPPGFTQVGIRRKFFWRGLQTDAEQFSEIEAIRELYAAEVEIRSLLERLHLTRVEGREP